MWHEGRSPPIADFINGIGQKRKSQDVQNDFRSASLNGHDRVGLGWSAWCHQRKFCDLTDLTLEYR
jgi:hypothetical protein